MSQKNKPPHPIVLPPKHGLTVEAYTDVQNYVDAVIEKLREDYPLLTDGQIYDAIAQDLERRCRVVIEWSRGKK